MATQVMAFPSVHIDAEDLLREVLSESTARINLLTYGHLFSSVADVVHIHVKEVDDDEGFANLDVSLTYTIRGVVSGDKISQVEKTRNLRFYSTLGDTKWTYQMKEKIWDGNYPTTVALDVDSGDVLLVNVKVNTLELVRFGMLEPLHLDAVLHDVNDREPFSIKIDEDALFLYADGAEGTNHLKDNVYINFNCGLPIKVRHTERTFI